MKDKELRTRVRDLEARVERESINFDKLLKFLGVVPGNQRIPIGNCGLWSDYENGYKLQAPSCSCKPPTGWLPVLKKTIELTVEALEDKCLQKRKTRHTKRG